MFQMSFCEQELAVREVNELQSDFQVKRKVHKQQLERSFVGAWFARDGDTRERLTLRSGGG
jgi:hypothetical protein